MNKHIEKKIDYSKAISYSNCILSILIILLHTDIPTNNLKYSARTIEIWHIVKSNINVVCDIAVPSFFIISAYLLFRRYERVSYLNLLKKKMITLALPFIMWNTLGMVYKFALSFFYGSEFEFSLSNLFNSVYNQPLWYIRTLFLFVIISPIIYKIIAISEYTIFICLIAVVINLVCSFAYISLEFWFPCYFLGAWFAYYKQDVIEAENTKYTFTDKKLYIIATILIIYVFGVLSQNTGGYYLYRIISGIIFVYYMWRISWKTMPKTYFQCSFYAFCCHALLLGVVPQICHKIMPNTISGLLGGYVLSVCVITIIIILTASILEKYFTSIYVLLTGGREKRS